MIARIVALVLLAVALVKTLLRRALPQRSPLRRFEESFEREGTLRVLPTEAQLLHQVGRCTACGRCDAEESARIQSSTQGYRGLMHFVLSGTRSLVDATWVAHTLAEVPDDALKRGEAACPEAVPIRAWAAFVRGHAARIERAQETTVSRGATP